MLASHSVVVMVLDKIAGVPEIGFAAMAILIALNAKTGNSLIATLTMLKLLPQKMVINNNKPSMGFTCGRI